MRMCFAVFALFALLAIAGCGGGSSGAKSESTDESVATEPVTVHTGSLTKAQFINRADSICEKGRGQFEGELEAFLRQHGKDVSLESVASLGAPEAGALVNEAFIPIHEKEIAEISSFGAPNGDRAEVTAILDAIQEGLGEARAQPLQFTQTSITQFSGFAKAIKLASSYGLSECGRS